MIQCRGPARGIRCTLEICQRVRDLGIEIRAGIHTGECDAQDRGVPCFVSQTGGR